MGITEILEALGDKVTDSKRNSLYQSMMRKTNDFAKVGPYQFDIVKRKRGPAISGARVVQPLGAWE